MKMLRQNLLLKVLLPSPLSVLVWHHASRRPLCQKEGCDPASHRGVKGVVVGIIGGVLKFLPCRPLRKLLGCQLHVLRIVG